jgi:hypothetical protein
MDDPGMIERVKVREVTGVLPSRSTVISAVDNLLLAGFDRADIDVVAGGARLGNQIGPGPVPAVELADIPGAPRQEFVAPEDTAAVFALSVAVIGSFGAMLGALFAIASRGTTAPIVIATVVGATIGCGLGILVARLLGWRWIQAPNTPASTDGLVLWVRVRTPDREQKAVRILQSRGAEAVRVHEIENKKRVEDIPLSSVRPDPWLGNERLGAP